MLAHFDQQATHLSTYFRTYEVFPGFIDVYTGDGSLTNRVKETRLIINSEFKVEPVSLPSRPFCIRVTSSSTKIPTSFVIESESEEQQMDWVDKIREEIDAAPKA